MFVKWPHTQSMQEVLIFCLQWSLSCTAQISLQDPPPLGALWTRDPQLAVPQGLLSKSIYFLRSQSLPGGMGVGWVYILICGQWRSIKFQLSCLNSRHLWRMIPSSECSRWLRLSLRILNLLPANLHLRVCEADWCHLPTNFSLDPRRVIIFQLFGYKRRLQNLSHYTFITFLLPDPFCFSIN
jgi:hypothetical protein